MNREKRIDVARGIAIILVILGHVIQYSTLNFDKNIVFRVIYSFHMPLFMFLSGYVCSLNRNKINFLYLLKKLQLLVLPFFTWFIVSYYWNQIYKSESIFDRLTLLIGSPDYGLWYLWTLFLMFVFFTLVIYIVDWLELFALEDLILVLGIYLLNKVPVSVFGLSMMKWYILFFSIGYFVFKYRLYVKKYYFKFKVFSIVLFPIFSLFWQRTTLPLFSDYLSFRVGALWLSLVIDIYNYLTPLFGIGFVLAFSDLVVLKTKTLFLLLMMLGGITLELYCVHILLLQTYGESSFQIFSSVISTLLMSFIVIFLLKQIKYLRILLFGKNY